MYYLYKTHNFYHSLYATFFFFCQMYYSSSTHHYTIIFIIVLFTLRPFFFLANVLFIQHPSFYH